MSAIPYNPQGPPQDEYVQQNQNQNQNQTGIAHAQQNDTGISYAPRRTTTNTYPPHEKGDFNAPVNQQTTPVHSQTSSPVHLQTSSPVHLHTAPVHSRMAPVHSYTAPVGPQTTPVNPQTAPVHPQTSPVYSQQPAVYTARPGTMIQSAQHFTPPIGPTQDWQHGMCGCFDSWSICCIGFWVPCVLYSRTHKRLRTSPSTVHTFSCCNLICWCNFCCTGGDIRQRDEIRYRYNLSGSPIGDCCRHFCCGPCSLCQEELEVRDRERQAARMHNAGYVAPQQMSYTQPPRPPLSTGVQQHISVSNPPRQ